MAFRTLFIESPCKLSYKSEYLVVRKEDSSTKVHLSEISSIVLQTQQAYVSAYLMAELAKHKISLVVSDGKRNPVGQYLPLYGAHNVSKRISEQLAWSEPAKKRVWQHVVRDKVFQQARLLEDLERMREAKLLYGIVPEVRSGDSTNREAQAARIYFQGVFGPEFARGQDTAENAALDYGYAILLSMVNREIVARGYLTQCGICHRSEYNQFNLACDFMEPFRPLVDRLVEAYVGDEFTRDVRLMLGDLANKELSYRGGVYRLSSVVSLYVQDCLNALAKRILPDEIEPFEFVQTCL